MDFESVPIVASPFYSCFGRYSPQHLVILIIFGYAESIKETEIILEQMKFFAGRVILAGLA